ncbi:MAG: addiction module protein [Verrucomicrobiota bacterium]
MESLDPAEDGVIHRLWAVEGQRRLQELRSGIVHPIPGEESIDRLRAKFSR